MQQSSKGEIILETWIVPRTSTLLSCKLTVTKLSELFVQKNHSIYNEVQIQEKKNNTEIHENNLSAQISNNASPKTSPWKIFVFRSLRQINNCILGKKTWILLSPPSLNSKHKKRRNCAVWDLAIQCIRTRMNCAEGQIRTLNRSESSEHTPNKGIHKHRQKKIKL